MSVPKVAAVTAAGTMGPRMAPVLARGGAEVRLHDISDEEVRGFVENRILYAILRECGSPVERGILPEETHGGIYPYTAEQVAERRAEIAKGLIAVGTTPWAR